MSGFSYTVDENTFCVRIYSPNQDPPIILQPNYPDNRAWESFEAAARWAESCIAGLDDPTVGEAPPVVEEAPPVVEEAPPVVEEAPPVVEEAPPVVEEAPPVVEEVPPVVEEAPSYSAE